ncbi:MAG: hypothetical protein R3C28_07205 [Pirellulaceae bacterium]
MDRKIRIAIEVARNEQDLHQILGLDNFAATPGQDATDYQGPFDRIQTWDAAIESSLANVELPSNLQAKLRNSLSQSQPTLVTPADKPKRFNRRQLLAAGGIAASLLTGYSWYLVSRRTDWNSVTENQLAHWGRLQRQSVDKNAWIPFAQAEQDVTVPIKRVTSSAPQYYQQFHAADFGCTAHAFLFSGNDNYVFALEAQQAVPKLASSPPTQPRRASGGSATGVWQSQNVVYVAVMGRTSDYRHLLNTTSTIASTGYGECSRNVS